MSVPGPPQRIAALPPPQVRQEPAEKDECNPKRPEAGQLGATSPQQSLKRIRRLGSPQQPEPPDDAVDMEVPEEAVARVVPDYPSQQAAFGQHDGKGDEQGSASISEDRGVEEEGGEDDSEDQTGEWRSNDVVCGTCDDGGEPEAITQQLPAVLITHLVGMHGEALASPEVHPFAWRRQSVRTAGVGSQGMAAGSQYRFSHDSFSLSPVFP